MRRAVLFGVVFFTVLLVWFITPLVTFHMFARSDERGQFGDLYGSINALYSGLAFAAVVLALVFQNDDLKTQRFQLQQVLAESEKDRREAKDAARRQVTTTLVEEWHSAKFVSVREYVDTEIVNRYMLGPHRPKTLTDMCGQDGIDKEKLAIFINYLDKMSSLVQTQVADSELLVSLMGRHLLWIKLGIIDGLTPLEMDERFQLLRKRLENEVFWRITDRGLFMQYSA